MSSFKTRITRIKDLSDRRRLPRLGIIRLGLKMKSARTGAEYPSETEYFVCPPEVKAIYGDKPTELDVMLPLNELESVFPCAYKYYGSSKGLKCQGDGETAYRVNDKKEMEQIPCPCELLESGKCKQSGTLMVMLPKVSVGGIYQIRTSSYNSIVDVNSGLDYVSALLGRFSLVPLKLRRVKTETHHDEKKQNHFTLQIIFDADITTLNALRTDTMRVLEHPRYQLPAPLEENPEAEPIDIIVEDEEAKEPPPEGESLNPVHPGEPQAENKASDVSPKKERTPAQKKLEVLISEAEIDREMFKKWLLAISWLNQNAEGKLSMNDIKPEHLKTLLDKFDSAKQKFSFWIDAKQKAKE